MTDTPPHIVTLNVGGRPSVVLRATLTDSAPLYAQTGERWKDHIQPDGSYFVDADPDIFAHVLNFLRRPTAYPLFWDKLKGFDYDLYNKVEKEADTWLVMDLANWIKEKKFEAMIKVVMHRPCIEDLSDCQTESFSGSTDVERQVVTKTMEWFICPHSIASHKAEKDAPKQCGAQCRKVQGDCPDDYVSEEYQEVIMMRKSIKFTSDV